MATTVTRRQMISRIGDALDELGWREDEDLGLRAVRQATEDGELDSRAAAELASATFLRRNDITRRDVRRMFAGLFSGVQLADEPAERASTSVSISGGTLTNVSIGGDQTTITISAAPGDLLDQLRDVVGAAAHDGEWELPALKRLVGALDDRDDIPAEQVQRAVADALEPAPPAGKVESLKAKLLTSVGGGLTVQAIVAAFNAAF